jgi:hypothetical protein
MYMNKSTDCPWCGREDWQAHARYCPDHPEKRSDRRLGAVVGVALSLGIIVLVGMICSLVFK